jgi:hypothetical protein
MNTSTKFSAPASIFYENRSPRQNLSDVHCTSFTVWAAKCTNISAAKKRLIMVRCLSQYCASPTYIPFYLFYSALFFVYIKDINITSLGKQSSFSDILKTGRNSNQIVICHDFPR